MHKIFESHIKIFKTIFFISSLFIGGGGIVNATTSCSKSKPTILSSASEIQNYLDKHKFVHNETFNIPNHTNDSTARTYFWDKNNYSPQNMANGFLFYILWEEYNSYKYSVDIFVNENSVVFERWAQPFEDSDHWEDVKVTVVWGGNINIIRYSFIQIINGIVVFEGEVQATTLYFDIDSSDSFVWFDYVDSAESDNYFAYAFTYPTDYPNITHLDDS